MQRYWSGVKVVWLDDAEEYDGLVEVAWRAWRHKVICTCGFTDDAAAESPALAPPTGEG